MSSWPLLWHAPNSQGSYPTNRTSARKWHHVRKKRWIWRKKLGLRLGKTGSKTIVQSLHIPTIIQVSTKKKRWVRKSLGTCTKVIWHGDKRNTSLGGHLPQVTIWFQEALPSEKLWLHASSASATAHGETVHWPCNCSKGTSKSTPSSRVWFWGIVFGGMQAEQLHSHTLKQNHGRTTALSTRQSQFYFFWPVERQGSGSKCPIQIGFQVSFLMLLSYRFNIW